MSWSTYLIWPSPNNTLKNSKIINTVNYKVDLNRSNLNQMIERSF